ncbi:pimeloyl-CoA dehydrogenase large subunit [Acuticoccus sediminis]|uniref:Pimeloyl-CoA dehydrogenase large subunit n=1 Tax=Acuticoccus sediminis TaxID=2184697 RepID=A0A8B2NIV9_9HYPH|nr:acyl-CoA dehydrogenase family protein [Acuticoccus sediminis]RAH98226.1 pimeloyl-CoA dehydrogenase large subunit [Acuticoccus sediminis]
MDLSFTPEEEAFRQEVRTFLAEKLPKDIAEKVKTGKSLTKDDHERWQRVLEERHWYATTWPKEAGGPGWTPVERHIFDEEMAMAHAPRIVSFGVHMLGPVLMKFGNEAQKSRYLPRILNQDDWWCQGYSEPGAGSDLASLKTRAVRDGDTYVINGQKTWTTLGQHADHIFCLVRTNPEVKPQEGISFILVDMATPGIEVRPIKLIEGGHEVNEVFFTDVRVPAENLVGEENKGWTVAKYLLTHERTGIAGVGFSNEALDRLKGLAREQRRNGKRLIDNPLFAARLSEIEIDLEAMKVTNLRLLYEAQKNGAPGPETSMMKIKGTVIRQALNDLSRRALGPAAAPFPSEDLEGNEALVAPEHAHAAASYFNNRKLSIFGGSNEIQRNILTKTVLGL